MQHIRVIVADDHDNLRTVLCRLLSRQPDIEVVGEARNGREAYDLAVSERPDVVVMDIEMPLEDGPSATRRIVSERLPVRVVLISANHAGDSERRATGAGAAGFVSKGAEVTQLFAAIRGAVRSGFSGDTALA